MDESDAWPSRDGGVLSVNLGGLVLEKQHRTISN